MIQDSGDEANEIKSTRQSSIYISPLRDLNRDTFSVK